MPLHGRGRYGQRHRLLLACGQDAARTGAFTGSRLALSGADAPAAPPFGFAIFPRPGEVFPKGESLWRNQKVHRSAKASPFGRGGREQRERTERARPSAKENELGGFPSPAKRGFTPLRDSRRLAAANAINRNGPSCEKSVPAGPQPCRNCKLKIIFPLFMPRVKRRAFQMVSLPGRPQSSNRGFIRGRKSSVAK